MNDFLFNQFINYSQETINEFQKNVVDFLPSFTTTPVTPTWTTSVWGNDGNNFWYVNQKEARYFETDGTIHVISASKDQTYFNNCTALYNNSVRDGMMVISKPLEFSDVTLTVDNHPCGLTNGDLIHYSKFSTPTGTYGTPYHLLIVSDNPNDATIINYLQKYLDSVTWILTQSKQITNGLYPEVTRLREVMCTNDGIIFPILPEFTLSAAEVLAAGEDMFTNASTTEKAARFTDLINNGRTKWTQALNN
jgi:hypothetical protein